MTITALSLINQNRVKVPLPLIVSSKKYLFDLVPHGFSRTIKISEAKTYNQMELSSL